MSIAARQVKLIAVSDVLCFQSDAKYMRVVLAGSEALIRNAAEGTARRPRSGTLLAGASRYNRQRRRGGERAPRGCRKTVPPAQGADRAVADFPPVFPSFQADVANAAKSVAKLPFEDRWSSRR